MPGQRLDSNFYREDVLTIAPALLGMKLIRVTDNICHEYIITEVEAYRGMEDLACHASKGKTRRTEVMFQEGGKLYIYLIYGMYYMLNIVTGPAGFPQAVLIRSLYGINGPGKLTKKLKIDNSFYGESITESKRIWIEKGIKNPSYITSPRIGIDYAGEYWKQKLWRWTIID